MSQPRRFWMRWRVRVGYPVALIYWALAAPTLRAILIGGVIASFGLIVRAVAAGYLRKDQQLASSGPYALSRNPLYLGSSFLAVGFAIAGHSWAAGTLIVVYFGVFYYAVMRNEEEDLRARFEGAFERYAAHVPLFFPYIFYPPRQLPAAAAEPPQGFSWKLYRRNREYRALLGTIGALAAMGLRIWVRTRFGY
jgi:protein-S-isoprenylcysteine O-methyltransferase Ste14